MISAKLEHLLNAYILILFVPSGISILVRAVLFSNAYSPIVSIDDGKVTSLKFNFVQFLKAYLLIVTMPDGIVTLVRFLLSKNADFAIAITVFFVCGSDVISNGLDAPISTVSLVGSLVSSIASFSLSVVT